MSTALRNIAIVGASGNLGPFILSALQSNSENRITIITRDSSSATFPTSQHGNTTVVRVPDDYPEDKMVAAFRGHDAAVLSLGFAADRFHDNLVRASIKAGVSRTIASSYGGTESNEAVANMFPIAKRKREINHELKQCESLPEAKGWTWTSICCGLFFDMGFKNGLFDMSLKERTAAIWGNGNVKFSATTMANVGRSVACVLAHPQETANRSVYISSFECSQNEVFESVKAATGTKDSEWTSTTVDPDEQIAGGLKEMANGNFMGIVKLAQASSFKEGYGQDFVAEGLLENERLGVEKENLDQVVLDLVRQEIPASS